MRQVQAALGLPGQQDFEAGKSTGNERNTVAGSRNTAEGVAYAGQPTGSEVRRPIIRTRDGFFSVYRGLRPT